MVDVVRYNGCMNIAVIAADGRSGRAFVKAALAAGHFVQAGVRGASGLKEDKNLKVMQCDATKPGQVRKLIKNTDVVVSLIGHVKGSSATVQADAITVIISEMKKAGIRRIVSLTGTGVRFKGDNVTMADRFLNLGIMLIDPDRVRDGKMHARVLKESGLNWTLLRVLKLQDTRQSDFTLNEHGPTKLYVSRQDVAQAILQVLRDDKFVCKSPILAKVKRSV